MQIVHLAERPDLAPLLADWLHGAFWQALGLTHAEVLERVATGIARIGTPQTFVALVDGVPAATASYAAHDLAERPQLSPWLAGVFTDPAFRGRDLASALVHRVEAVARAEGHGTLWLYTSRAEGLYLKLGWTTAETIPREGRLPAILMSLKLGGDGIPGASPPGGGT